MEFGAGIRGGAGLTTSMQFTVSQVDGDMVIDLGAGDRMILEGVQLALVPEGWIYVGS